MKFPFPYDEPSVADSGDEIAIQTRLRSRIRMLGAGKVRAIAFPNAGKRTAWAAMQAKREGMASGIPDLEVKAAPGLTAHLEIKARTGSLSTDQVNWLNWLHSAGFPCGCFRSVDTAIIALRKWGFPL